jgi:hypothetical protein
MQGTIPIGDARKISEQRACPLVVIFGIEAGAERFTVTTYGANTRLCRLAASFGKQCADAIFNGTVSPAEADAVDLPDEPVMYRGQRRGEPPCAQDGPRS